MSKSACTQCRYAKANKNQTAFTHFRFMTASAASHSHPSPQFQQKVISPSEIDRAETVDPLPVIPCHRSSTVLSDPVMSEAEMTSGSDAEGAGDDEDLGINVGEDESQFSADTDDAEMQAEDWEDELEETVCGPINQVKGWDELQKQIKEDL